MTTWITANWFFGDTRLEFLGRPYTTISQMTETLILNHNSLVAPEDEVIVNGDMCFDGSPESLAYISHLNGIKTLIRGDYDEIFSDEVLLPYFNVIVPDGMYYQIGDLNCYITHNPLNAKEDAFNLIAHSPTKYQLNSLNVGIDHHNYCPLNFDDVNYHYALIQSGEAFI